MNLPAKTLTLCVSLALSAYAVADDYNLPFASNSAGGQSTGALTVDEGQVLGGSATSSKPVVVSSHSSSRKLSTDYRGSNLTATAGASENANSSDNPAVDGRNVQPVPNNVVSSRMNDDVVSSRQDIVVEPGVNTLIPIAKGQINRIVTPFDRPTVQRLQIDSVKVNVEGNVIYVYTPDTRPVALYISEKGDESVSISLSLVPQQIAPVQATVMLSRKLNNAPSTGNSGIAPIMYGGSETKAKKWEQKDTYVETIRNILRTIALGDLPPGYALGNLNSGVSIPNCNFSTGTVQDYIRYSFKGGQFINGSQFSVIVGVAQNTGPTTVTVDESLCTHPRMAARALWSRNTLEPGQKTEAYFVLRNEQQQQAREDDNARPKLAE